VSWKIKDSNEKREVKDVSCSVDEIVDSVEVKRICKKYNIKLMDAHRIVSDVLIKVLKERSMKAEQLFSKYSYDRQGIMELALEAVRQGNRMGVVNVKLGEGSLEEEFKKLTS